jgi:hypothetical protein
MASSIDPRKRKFLVDRDDEDEVEDEDEAMPQVAVPIQIITPTLPSKIITPSPFPQHATEDRFRNALQRVTADPKDDTEAWQALMTEVNASFAVADTSAKLDWVESCFGALLYHFPYAVIYLVRVSEILLQQYTTLPHRRPNAAAKLGHIFQTHLGVDSSSSSNEESGDLAMCSWVVDLWMVYIRKVEFDAGDVKTAYDLALDNCADVYNNDKIWKAAVEYTKRSGSMTALRSVYQRLVVNPMTGLDQLWQEYELFEKAQSEVLAAALLQEYAPKYTHARSVYLERNRTVPGDLQYGRLATATDSDDALLHLWKIKVSYERTNPARLTGRQYTLHVRRVFQAFICTFTRHPEVWHMWSMWDGELATQILARAESHIADSTFLAYSRAQLLEETQSDAAIAVMEEFVQRSPNTLGYVLLQQLVRRYRGQDAARTIFSRARQALVQRKEESTVAAGAMEETLDVAEDMKKDVDVKRTTTLVKNRHVDGAGNAPIESKITWHLYAAHAAIEHRQNHLPVVAARIYELGIKSDPSFVAVPAYVQRYAQVLMEINDLTRLRSLLTKAVSACEAEGNKVAVASLWDISLHFESLIGSKPSKLREIEKKRREALLGPDVEDVATGGILGFSDTPVVGMQKATISELLVREEGYDKSSLIISGMSRLVEALGLMGFWGDGSLRKQIGKELKKTHCSGGDSDLGFQKRLKAQYLANGGEPGDFDVIGGTKTATTRERLQQHGTAIMLTIQQSPEWLRPFLLMLPFSKTRPTTVAKPPPHLTEKALAELRANPLPAERPKDDPKGAKRMVNGDSDDDDAANSSGYGAAFRKRQKIRMDQSGHAMFG